MIIKADYLEELYAIYRNTPNPITGEKPLFKDLSDADLWASAFEAGKRRAAQGIAKSSVQQAAGQNAPTYLCPECKEQWELAHFAQP